MSYARSAVVHISARLWLSAHKRRSFYDIRISQGSVATHWKRDGKFNNNFIAIVRRVCQSKYYY